MSDVFVRPALAAALTSFFPPTPTPPPTPHDTAQEECHRAHHHPRAASCPRSWHVSGGTCVCVCVSAAPHPHPHHSTHPPHPTPCKAIWKSPGKACAPWTTPPGTTRHTGTPPKRTREKRNGMYVRSASPLPPPPRPLYPPTHPPTQLGALPWNTPASGNVLSRPGRTRLTTRPSQKTGG